MLQFKMVIDETRHIAKQIDRLIYTILYAGTTNETDSLSPSVSEIAEKARCSECTVRYALRTLQTLNLIDIKPSFDDYGQSTNLYTLLPIPTHFINGVTNGNEDSKEDVA
ncbi:helix-turn-helix domain-containing protein [Bacillus cereus]|uniref:helix-turn-helix domain-containing protein n=1 Tax=Bacillus cereus TaxID=1396 RepID=UPI000BF2D271|nr:helix-turn-helix domain-containing protein [Bacillus cereus]PFJ29346.1 helix-turn-helix domain-containing protein [Bacillus cereus]PFO23557.1 helix-turn-helix domain-containing protein [Bacillus cereus]PGN66015.1 helix-turn-helix domain-containing protein [Bacillus cereus]